MQTLRNLKLDWGLRKQPHVVALDAAIKPADLSWQSLIIEGDKRIAPAATFKQSCVVDAVKEAELSSLSWFDVPLEVRQMIMKHLINILIVEAQTKRVYLDTHMKIPGSVYSHRYSHVSYSFGYNDLHKSLKQAKERMSAELEIFRQERPGDYTTQMARDANGLTYWDHRIVMSRMENELDHALRMLAIDFRRGPNRSQEGAQSISGAGAIEGT